jgi:trehalose-6-phosphatase
MANRIEEENLSFAFDLVRFSQIDYQLFLSSDKADEVVFAVLGNFGSIDPETAAEQIIEKLQKASAGKTELNRHSADVTHVSGSNS